MLLGLVAGPAPALSGQCYPAVNSQGLVFPGSQKLAQPLFECRLGGVCCLAVSFSLRVPGNHGEQTPDGGRGRVNESTSPSGMMPPSGPPLTSCWGGSQGCWTQRRASTPGAGCSPSLPLGLGLRWST